jgi:hypothetical protein
LFCVVRFMVMGKPVQVESFLGRVGADRLKFLF